MKDRNIGTILGLVFAALTACVIAAGTHFYVTQKEHFRREVEKQFAAVAELKGDDLAHWRTERLGDANEALASMRAHYWATCSIVGAILFVGSLVLWFLWRQHADAIRQERLDAEIAMRKNLDAFRIYVENSTDVIFVLNPQGEFTFLSSAWERLSGHSTAETLGKPLASFIHPDDMAQSIEHLRYVLGTGNSATGPEFRIRHADGRWLWGRANGSRYVDPNGEVRFIGVGRDITEQKAIEDALRESEARYEQLAAQSRTVTWEVDAVGLFTYVSDVAESVYGYRPEELVGKVHFYDLHPEAGREEFTAMALDVMKRQESFINLINPMQHKDGRLVWLSTNGFLLHNADGTARGYCGSDIDVTDRICAEAALRESEELYRSLVENVDVGITMIDPNYRIIAVNTAQTNIFGKSVDQFIGRKCHCEFEKRENLCDHCPGAKAMATGRPAEVETVGVRDDGTCLNARIRAFPLYHPDGSPRGFIETVEDITQRKRADELLRESEEWYRTLFIEARDGICLVDATTGLIIDCNQALTELVERDKSELIGQQQTILHPPAGDGNRFSPTFRQHLNEKEGKILDTQVVTKTGERKDVAIRARILNLGGRLVMQGLFRDTTDRNRAEKKLQSYTAELELANTAMTESQRLAESASRAKSEFLANMSHEIRTPMTAILGYADLLLEENVGRATREHVAVIKRNGEHLLRLIGDILDLSKVESGKLQIERSRCSPAQVAFDLAALMRPQAEGKNLKLALDLDEPLPETILTDTLRLRQILVNLLGNAIKFTDRGEVRLAVRFTTEDAKPRVRFDVIDTGVGMDDRQIGKLFQPFTQVDSSATRSFGGTGLGLCISKRLTEALGGDIEVRSTPGQGSTFSVLLDPGPLEGVPTVSGAEKTAAASPAALADPDIKNIVLHGRVLLAEDGVDNQRLIGRLLRKAGAQVQTVENGRMAVEAALASIEEGRPFDLIFMDMQMPVMDGYAATRQLRERGYSAPIVALTAHSMNEDRQKCLDAQCDDYLAKPFEWADLLRTAARYLPVDQPVTRQAVGHPS